MTYLFIALSCLSIALSIVAIVALVKMSSTKDPRRKMRYYYVGMTGLLLPQLIHAQWWNYALVAFVVVMMAVSWVWERRRRTQAVPPR